MHVLLHAGLDPASQSFGVAWIAGDGFPLRIISEDKVMLRSFAHFTASKSGRAHRNLRLDSLENAIMGYLLAFPDHYFGMLDRIQGTQTTWAIASFAIEQPSDHFHRGERRERDSHDTQFVNGMSARMAYAVCRDYMRVVEKAIPVFEVKPSDSSSALGLMPNVPKHARLASAAQLGESVYRWDGYPMDMKKAGVGWAEGGRLHGANADSLDALAVANCGYHLFQQQQILQRAQEGSVSCPQGDQSGSRLQARKQRR